MKELSRVLVTRTGNGASFTTCHSSLSDAERLYSGFWNTRYYHITVQIDYTDGTSDLMENYYL